MIIRVPYYGNIDQILIERGFNPSDWTIVSSRKDHSDFCDIVELVPINISTLASYQDDNSIPQKIETKVEPLKVDKKNNNEKENNKMNLEKKATTLVKSIEDKIEEWFNSLQKKPLKTGIKTVLVLYLVCYLLNWLKDKEND